VWRIRDRFDGDHTVTCVIRGVCGYGSTFAYAG
jgi:hypothetical protein